MALWVWLAILAAFLQNMRFMIQRHLTFGGVSPVGATYARFAFSAPLVLGVVALAYSMGETPCPAMNGRFWFYAALGGFAQIAATVAVLVLFKQRNFAVGITLKKVETLLTVLVGLIILGDRTSAFGLFAILVGIVGVIVLSDPPETDRSVPLLRRVLNTGTALGLLSGLFFAFSAVFYRGALLELTVEPLLLQAGTTLAMVGMIQVIGLTFYLWLRETGTIGKVFSSWKATLPLGLLSAGGSWLWFAAFAETNAAYVFAVGQIEVIFGAVASVFVFKEKITLREGLGIFLITASIIVLVLTT